MEAAVVAFSSRRGGAAAADTVIARRRSRRSNPAFTAGVPGMDGVARARHDGSISRQSALASLIRVIFGAAERPALEAIADGIGRKPFLRRECLRAEVFGLAQRPIAEATGTILSHQAAALSDMP